MIHHKLNNTILNVYSFCFTPGHLVKSAFTPFPLSNMGSPLMSASAIVPGPALVTMASLWIWSSVVVRKGINLLGFLTPTPEARESYHQSPDI